ncbi:MAG: helicase HerA-like domain-containing protein [Candidatus Micrarchaeia archaeon]
MLATHKSLGGMMPLLNTVSERELISGLASGIYLGLDADLHRPTFLDFEKLVNPHVFVCGMSGSGKTFLLKSLAVKLASLLGMRVFCIDFTGEYSGLEEYGIERIDLSSLDEEKKKELADKALESIVKGMRKRGMSKLNTFVVLDESWKLVKSSAYFNSLLREGRKYGIGVIMATQLIGDMELGMLDNVSTLFVFRLQNEDELNKLAASYNLPGQHIRKVQSAGVGSCLVVMLGKRSSAPQQVFVVERVAGYKTKEYVRLYLGGGVYVEVDLEKFGSMASTLCSECAAKLLDLAKQKKTMEIDEIVAMLMERVPSLQIIDFLRKLGIKDGSIADSFARVLAEE